MTSTVKSGFSTINRLLGKKSKDEAPADPSLSTSSFHSSPGSPSSMFSRSMSNLDTTSQYNKIVPLAAMSNAPFEQTFRITVSLPRDQLYVVRVGAKTKLHQILEMTCTAKQLDRDKFEFRHPADNSMVFSNEFTIGEVGLNEIRLVPTNESHHSENNFSSAEVAKMRAGNRNSYAAPVSSNGGGGELIGNGTRRNGQPVGNLVKSPHSSMNSLNSFESGGQTRQVYQKHQQQQQNGIGQPVAPMRKKRAAPRPPSQNVIPEDSPIRQMNFHVSSPNLSQDLQSYPVNGTPKRENGGGMRPLSMFHESVDHQSSFSGSTTDLSPRRLSRTESNASAASSGDLGPRHVPRRKKAAPAPPPRTTRESIAPPQSIQPPPVPTPRTITPVPQERLEMKEPSDHVSKTLLNVEGSLPDHSSASFEVAQERIVQEVPVPVVPQPRVEMQVAVAIVTETQITENVQKENTTPVRDERMNIYNLDTGNCVEAEVVPNKPEIVAEEPEIVSEAIEEMILDSIKEQVVLEQRREEKRPQIVEDLYAEVKKAPKKMKNAEEEHPKRDTKDERSDSPLWTYTLPAPPHFADGNNNNLLMVVANGKGPPKSGAVVPPAAAPAPTETFNSNVYYNYTEVDDGDSIAHQSMTTTVVSDVLITPVIKERIPMLEQQPLMLPLDDDDDEEHFNNNNHSESSDFNSSSTLTSAASPNNLDEERRKKLIINSDIEDGYHGVPMDRMMIVNQGLIDTLEKRRGKFIENELEQLVKAGKEQEEQEEKARHQKQLQDINGNVEREVINLFEEESMTLKSTAIISAENQEPTISASPVEDGLPRTEDFLRRDIQRFDSFNSSNVGDSTSGEDSKNESLEMHVAPQIDLASQSFEQRRNSFLAELESSKNLFNRRTSSELSISESPSALQSIQVMRSIMKNTPRKEEPEETATGAISLPVNKEKKVKEPEVKLKEPEKTVASPNPNPAPVVVDEPKPWKYTGPPKINLGSWSERPKIQVCLKTDSDYHHSLEQQQQRRRDAEKLEQSIDEARIQNGTPAVEVKVEEKLPIVRAMELKKAISVPDDVPLAVVVPKAEPIVVAKMQRPISMHSTKFTPTVRGFLAATKAREEDDEIRSTRINPVLMRSDSNVVAKANGGIAVKSPPVTPDKPAIFSQSTLRRTGFKDRILAQPEESVARREEENVVKMAAPALEPKVPLKSVVVAAVSAEKSQFKEVVSSPISPPPPPPPAPPKLMPIRAPGALLNPLARLAADEPKVAQKPIVRGVVAKKVITPEVDTRSELLDSIRNFSFHHLRKM